jgi:hypothetical protein
MMAVALIAWPADGAASPARHPRLPAEAKDVAGFVPAGWKLPESAEGDLNKDGLADVVGVIEKKTKTEPDPGDTGPPRVLFVGTSTC